MDKNGILQEIKRTAAANGGQPLGTARFREETGIKDSDWFGRYWRAWGDALREAGFRPNAMQAAYDREGLARVLLDCIRELGRFPAKADLLLKRRSAPSFQSHNVFTRAFGTKRESALKLLTFSRDNGGYEDLAAILEPLASSAGKHVPASEAQVPETVGYVYLVRHGSRREYKIGKTINPIRREGEIGIELPMKVEPEHLIKTDDPSGVERYWHTRFASKRMNGEWFSLSTQDVRAFKKWRRIW